MIEAPRMSNEEHVVASAVAKFAACSAEADNSKRLREDQVEIDIRPSKMFRGETNKALVSCGPPHPSVTRENSQSSGDGASVLKPYPSFYYRDFSTVPDPDPLVPLTSPGRVPNFPAKMHSMLSRPDLADIVAWMPHGRSWRVLKPREFEKTVIPTYFEHAKFSSFIRQANGWGFRRITQGRDRNTYYHEMFLRGLPHLCKMMKRPGVSEKHTTDPEHEPDLFKISEEKPVPERAEDESILLHCTLQGGPKARMPIYFGNLCSKTTASTLATTGSTQQISQFVGNSGSNASPMNPTNTIPPSNGTNVGTPGTTTYAMNSISMPNSSPGEAIPKMNHFPSMMPTFDMPVLFRPSSNMPAQQQQQRAGESTFLPQTVYAAPTHAPVSQVPTPGSMSTAFVSGPCISQNQAMNPPAGAVDGASSLSPLANPLWVMPSAFQGNPVAAAQFAAGFAAAAALSNHNFQQMLEQAFGSVPPTTSTSNSNSNVLQSSAGAQQQEMQQRQQQGITPSQQQQQQQQQAQQGHQQSMSHSQQQAVLQPYSMPQSPPQSIQHR